MLPKQKSDEPLKKAPPTVGRLLCGRVGEVELRRESIHHPYVRAVQTVLGLED